MHEACFKIVDPAAEEVEEEPTAGKATLIAYFVLSCASRAEEAQDAPRCCP